MRQVKLFPITTSLLPTQDLRSLRNLFMAAEEVLKMGIYVFVCLLLFIHSYYNVYAYLQESALFYHVGFWDWTQVVRLGWKSLDSSTHPKGSEEESFNPLQWTCNLRSWMDRYTDWEVKKILRSKKDKTPCRVIHTPFSNSSLKDFSGKGTPCTKCEELKTWHHSWPLTELEELPCDKGGGLLSPDCTWAWVVLDLEQSSVLHSQQQTQNLSYISQNMASARSLS